MEGINLTLEDFEKFADFIYRKTGIRFDQKNFFFFLRE